MLSALSIRDVVLIDAVDLKFGRGLTVLTGETGAGKSILLDALGLAIGARAESGLVRQGAEKASVTAEFDLPANHPGLNLLRASELDVETPLILRRQVTADGKSRAFINDQAVSINLLRQLGQMLVEIHGQFDQHGLLDPSTHRGMLDCYGYLQPQVAKLKAAFAEWRDAEKALAAAIETREKLKRDEEYLRHAVKELEALSVEQGEEEKLAERRITLMHKEKLLSGVAAAISDLEGDSGSDKKLLSAQRHLSRIADKAPQELNPIIESLDRAALEIKEALNSLHGFLNADDFSETTLEGIEDRLFAIRDIARKYECTPDDLPQKLRELQNLLSAIDNSGGNIADLQKKASAAKKSFRDIGEKLSVSRAKAAKELDKAIAQELEPLKLGKAKFISDIEALPEDAWQDEGMEKIEFKVMTNPGMPAGSLSKIASGGELSRFMLALKVVLAKGQNATTLIFDEIDSGIGGAVADAVGERLARLSDSAQVLVVTHAPQVAARGASHLRVSKESQKNKTTTLIETLNAKDRREEVARMLSGASITDEARKAADKLLGAA